MDEKNMFKEYDEMSESNSTDNSILSMYSNVKKMNTMKNLIAENNEEILKQFSKYDEKVFDIQEELNGISSAISQIQSDTMQNIKALENKLNDNIFDLGEERKKETEKSIQILIEKFEKVEKDKETSKKEKKELNLALNKQFKEAENKNKNLIFKKIEELNISQIRDEIIRLEELIVAKTSELSNAFDSVESQNKDLKNSLNIEKENTNTIIINNIENIKEEISNLQKETLNKIKETEGKLLSILSEENVKTEGLITESISKLNISELTNSISELEKLNEEKNHKIEDNVIKLEELINSKTRELSNTFNNQLENVESQNEEFKNAIELEKANTKTFVLANIENMEKGILEFEKDALNRLQESEQKLLQNLEEERTQRESLITESISNLNIDDVRKSISDLQLSSTKKLKELENTVTQKIEELNYTDTIKSIENSILEQNERVLNVEHLSNSISKKVEELDSINQRKLDKVKKEQEKFITKKITELDNTQEITELKTNLQKIVDKTQYIETLIQEANKKSLLDMQDYVEKRILRMKYATTIQQITREIAKLNKKINLLQSAQDNEDEQKANIEYIVEQKLAQREKELMKNVESIIEERVQKTIKEMLKKQKAKKEQASIAKRQREITSSIHNVRRNTARSAPTSLDDMVNTLQKRSNTTRNAMSTLNKTIRKSQILNSND